MKTSILVVAAAVVLGSWSNDSRVLAQSKGDSAAKVPFGTSPSLRLDVAALALSELPAAGSGYGVDRRLFIDGQDRATVSDDRNRARRGGFLIAAGIPLAVTGMATLILGAALPNEDYCGNPHTKREPMIVGGAMAAVGFGFSSGAITALRRTTHHARRMRSRRTRAGVIVTGLVASGIGLGILTAFGVNSLCLAS
ncbi:MAG: hypothetical protein AAF500_14430 [Myxococcota bacterium]